MLNKILVEEITKSIHEIVDSIAVIKTAPHSTDIVRKSDIKIAPGMLSKMIPNKIGRVGCGAKHKKNVASKLPTEDQTAKFPITPETSSGETPPMPGTETLPLEFHPEISGTEPIVDVELPMEKMPLIKRIIKKMAWMKNGLGEEYIPTYCDVDNKLYEMFKPYKKNKNEFVMFVENSKGKIYKIKFNPYEHK